jgi:hypothetical protein
MGPTESGAVASRANKLPTGTPRSQSETLATHSLGERRLPLSTRSPRRAPPLPLSSRPKRSPGSKSGGARSRGKASSHFGLGSAIRIRECRSHLPFGTRSSLEAPSLPLSSRPKRSTVERSLCGCSLLIMVPWRQIRRGAEYRVSQFSDRSW